MNSPKDNSNFVWPPHLSDFIFISVFLLVLLSGSQMLSIDSDLGRHITLGNYIIDSHIIPATNILSFTLSGQSRPPYEWLSQVIFAFAYRFLHLDGVILLTALIIATTFTLLFQFANRRSKLPIAAFIITLLSIGASSLHWLPRPHIITFLLLTIWIEKLESIRNGKSNKWFVLPFLMLFWANLHGGFIFGILAWIAYMTGWIVEKWQGKTSNIIGQRLLIAGITSLLATVITPNFWRNWEAVLNNRSSFIISHTVETLPPKLTDITVLPFTILLVLALLLFFINRKQTSASHFFLLLGLGIMSLTMARNIPLFAVASTPIICELLSSTIAPFRFWFQLKQRFSSLSNQKVSFIYPFLLIVLTASYFFNHYQKGHQTIFQFNKQIFPVEAMNWLATHPQDGNMFNEFNWGGYILYRTWPQYLVFVDSQSDFYGETLLKDYEQTITAQGNWETLLTEYQITWVIIPPDSPLASTLNKEKNWRTIYKDGTAIIIRKAQ